MRSELDPEVVQRQLAALSVSFRAETLEEGTARLRREAMTSDAFATGVAQRLDELRALDDLTRYLHARRPR